MAAHFFEPQGTTVDFTIPAGVEGPKADVTVNTGTTLVDVETDYTLATGKVWTRNTQEDDPFPQPPQRLTKYDEALNELEARSICHDQSGFDGYLPNFKGDGLEVTFGDRPLVLCTSEDNGNPSLHYTLENGVWDPTLPVKIGGSQNRDVVPVEARTANDIAWGTSTSFVAQLDIFTLESNLKSWDYESIDISKGDRRATAFTGSSGTRAVTEVLGAKIAPDLGEAFDSIQVRNRTVWAADADTDELRRYQLGNQTWNLTHTTTLATNDSHVLSLSKDGRYLAGMTPTNVTVFNATNLSRLVITNQTISGGPQGADIDANNDYLYVAGLDTLYRFPIYNKTVSFDGEAGQQGQPNPASTGDPTQGETDDPEGIVSDDDPDGFAGVTQTKFANAFGTSEEAAGWFLGMFFILVFAAFFWSVTRRPMGALAGAFGGIAFSIAFTWIPLWFVIFAGIVAAAMISFRGA